MMQAIKHRCEIVLASTCTNRMRHVKKRMQHCSSARKDTMYDGHGAEIVHKNSIHVRTHIQQLRCNVCEGWTQTDILSSTRRGDMCILYLRDAHECDVTLQTCSMFSASSHELERQHTRIRL